MANVAEGVVSEWLVTVEALSIGAIDLAEDFFNAETLQLLEQRDLDTCPGSEFNAQAIVGPTGVLKDVKNRAKFWQIVTIVCRSECCPWGTADLASSESDDAIVSALQPGTSLPGFGIKEIQRRNILIFRVPYGKEFRDARRAL
jgi:hypothetical protein